MQHMQVRVVNHHKEDTTSHYKETEMLLPWHDSFKKDCHKGFTT